MNAVRQKFYYAEIGSFVYTSSSALSFHANDGHVSSRVNGCCTSQDGCNPEYFRIDGIFFGYYPTWTARLIS
jgi:hypothetical protein